MRRKLILIALALLSVLLLSGCTGGGGGFDIVKFLQNPFVMIIIAIFIVGWMWKGQKK